MRKDSEMFLKKILDFRREIGMDSFVLNYKYFQEIPNIETTVFDIINDLIVNNCLTSKSQVTDLAGNIAINLTLDGITYFEEVKERIASMVFNVSGGQVNVANDSGYIGVNQNNNFEGNQEERRNSEEWMGIIEKWCEYIDIDNWEVWTSYLLGSGLPRMRVDRAERLDELRQWILRRVWPEGCDEVKETLLNFYAVLNDFIILFHKHSENNGTVYYTDKFYHINQWDTELYDKLLLEFRNHVNLVDDMVLEMTRAANYVCDMVRQYIAPGFRTKEGKLVVVTGPNKELSYDTLRPEYRGEDRKTFAPYNGLEQFRKDRYNRDFYWGHAEE